MKIEKEELLKALTAVKPGLSTKDVIEQATSFAFVDGHVVTYNDEIAVRYPISLKIQGAIRANELYALLSKVKEKELDITVTDNEFLIKGKRSKAGIRLETEIKLPLEELGTLDKGWKKIPKGYLEALKMSVFCATNDMSKPILTCVSTDKDKVVASDGYRIIRTKLEKPLDSSFLIPATAVRLLSQYKVTQYTHTNNWAHFKAENGLIFSCRTFAEKFPKVAHFFKMEGAQLTFPKGLGEMLDKAGIFTTGISDAEDEIHITIKENKITIKGEGAFGWFEEKAKCSYEGDEINFAIAPNFLKDILKHLQKCIVSESAMLFKGDNFEHFVTLSVI